MSTKTVTAAEAAKYVFTSESNFQRLLRCGAIERTENRRYDLDVVRKQLLTHYRNVAANRRSQYGDDLKLSHEKARLAKEQADKVALDNAKARDELVAVDDVIESFAPIAIAIRQKILGSSMEDYEKDDILEEIVKFGERDFTQ